MSLRNGLALLSLASVLCGCSPAFNWRETRLEPSGLVALLPCRPDHGSRIVPLAGQSVELRMVGCDAQGATFAVAFADLGDASRAPLALAQWQSATLANLHATGSRDTPFVPHGATLLAASVLAVASGQGADGRRVTSRAAYFARGAQVFQAVIYADKLDPEVADTFFSGLRWP